MVSAIELATWAITLFSAGLGSYALLAGHTPSARWLGSFFLWLSTWYARELLPLEAYEHPAIWILRFIGSIGIVVSFFGFAYATFEAWKPMPSMPYIWAWGLGGTAFLLFVFSYLGGLPRPLFQGPDPSPTWVWRTTSIFSATSNVALILVAIMHPAIVRHAPEGKARAVRGLALLSVGLACLIGGAPAWIRQTIGLDEAPWNVLEAAGLAMLVACTAGGWLYATRGAHRRLAWRTFAAIAAVFAIGSALSMYSPQTAYLPLRITGLSLIFVAMMRGQIAGLDRRLRFTISKTTVATIFVAVFFIVSETAAAFFGDRAGNQYYGIAAAGLLVFAIAPIMRWADGFAKAAVPMAQDPAAIFRAAVKATLADGHISSKEELHLAEVAEGLGLSPTQTTQIRLTAMDDA